MVKECEICAMGTPLFDGGEKLEKWGGEIYGGGKVLLTCKSESHNVNTRAGHIHRKRWTFVVCFVGISLLVLG